MTDQKIEIGTSAELLAASDEMRRKVFIDEQGIPEDEIFDGFNSQAIHIVAYDGIFPVATSRVRLLSDNGKSYQIGLVAVDKPRRDQHLGEKMMKVAIEYVASHGGSEILLTAQQQAFGFYKKIGFEPCGVADALESGFVLVPMKYTIV